MMRIKIDTTVRSMTLLIVILFLSTGFAGVDRKWGEVPEEILNLTVYPDDTTAKALVIFDTGQMEVKVSNQISLTLERHYMIKILKAGGEEIGNISIPYWYKDKIRKLKAQTILPDGKRIKLNKKMIFDEEFKQHHRVKSFAMPSLEAGAIVEVQYILESEYIQELEPWVFQWEVPVLESVLQLRMTPGLVYRSLIQNDPFLRVKQEQESYIDMNYRNQSLTQFIYRALNLPAVKREPYISSLSNYKIRLDFQIQSYRSPYGSTYSFIKDMETLCSELMSSPFGNFMKPTGKTRKVVEGLVSPDDSDRKRAEKIYCFVRDQFEPALYNSSIYARNKQNELMDKKIGSSSEINLLLLAMLKAAGLDARPVLISTLEHGHADTQVPFLNQYNLTIVSLMDGRHRTFLNANNKYLPFGLLPSNNLVDVGLEITQEGHSEVKIYNYGIKAREILQSEIIIDPEGKLSGESKVLSAGYKAIQYQWTLDASKNISEFFQEKLFDHVKNLTILEADSSLQPSPADTFSTAFRFAINNAVEVIDDELYIKPIIFHNQDRNIFISEKREFPVEFGYRFETVEENTIVIPEGYTIAELPEDKWVGNEFVSYSRKIKIDTQDPSRIICTRRFLIKDLVVPGTRYEFLRKCFGQIVAEDQSYIILRAI